MAWRYDMPHSRIGFVLKHFGLTFVHGHFRTAEINFDYDADDFAKSSVEVTIDPKSLTTDVERRDTAAIGEHYLDSQLYPTITFKSKRIEPRGGNRYAVIGDFSLHGVTRELELDTVYAGEAVDAREFTLRGFSARGKINKSDYGIQGSPLEPNVGEEIQLVIDVELRQP